MRSCMSYTGMVLELNRSLCGCADVRAASWILRYAEQACNHFIAFKLLALIRDKVFGALRRLCPAKLDGKIRATLISIITSDIEITGSVLRTYDLTDLYCRSIQFCDDFFYRQYHAALGGGTDRLCDGWALIPFVTSRLSGMMACVFVQNPGSFRICA